MRSFAFIFVFKFIVALPNNSSVFIIWQTTIEFGTFRLKKNGSFGGHNGIKSIINRIGTDVFDRLKVGVGPVPQNIPIDSFVLGNFTNDELINVNKMAKVAVDLVDCWLKDGIEVAQNKFNSKVI